MASGRRLHGRARRAADGGLGCDRPALARRTAPPRCRRCHLGRAPAAWRRSRADRPTLRARRRGGAAVPAQFWPLATWPDGSLKWVGAAIGATDAPAAGYAVRAPRFGRGRRSSNGLGLSRLAGEDAITIDTGGPSTCVVRPLRARCWSHTHRARRRGGRRVTGGWSACCRTSCAEDGGRAARPTSGARSRPSPSSRTGRCAPCVRDRGQPPDDEGAVRGCRSRPPRRSTRAAERPDGAHRSSGTATPSATSSPGSASALDVPMRAAPHDRHVRIAGADGGLLRRGGPRAHRPAPRSRAPRCARRRWPGRADAAARGVGPRGVASRLELHPRLGRLHPRPAQRRRLRRPQAHRRRPRLDRRRRAARGPRASATSATPSGGFGVGLARLLAVAPGPARHPRRGDRAGPSSPCGCSRPRRSRWTCASTTTAWARTTSPTSSKASRSPTRTTSRASATPHGIARTHELTLFALRRDPADRGARRSTSPRCTPPAAARRPRPSTCTRRASSATGRLVDRSHARARARSRTSSTSSSTSTSARSSSAAGTGSGTTATSCTPTTPTGTCGATTSAATRGTTPSCRRTCGSGTRTCAPAAPTSSGSPRR